jgi:hypothetical protein
MSISTVWAGATAGAWVEVVLGVAAKLAEMASMLKNKAVHFSFMGFSKK